MVAAAGTLPAPPPPNTHVPDWFGPYRYTESHAWDGLTDTLLLVVPTASIATPVTFEADAYRAGVAGQAGIALTTHLVTLGLKRAIGRPRPYWQAGRCVAEGEDARCDGEVVAKAHVLASMPSGHTSMVAASSTAWVVRYALNNDDPVGLAVAASVATTLTTTTAIGRVKAGKHHPSDVVMGGLLGAGIGVLGALTIDAVAGYGEEEAP